MDLNQINNRLMMLECLRENASNMRIEQQKLRERITQALQRSRDSLVTIQELNVQLREMKMTVENALAADLQELEGTVNKDLSEETLDASPEQPQEEIIDENREEIANDVNNAIETLDASPEQPQEEIIDENGEEIANDFNNAIDKQQNQQI